MSKDMKLIMENFRKNMNESESILTEGDFDKFLRAFADNVNDYKKDNQGKDRQDEGVGTAFLLWGFITKGAALAGLAEMIFSMVKKLISKARKKFNPKSTAKWKTEQWAENLEMFTTEVRRGFATGGAHTFLKFVGKFFGEVFSTDAAQDKIDQFADGISIIVAIAVLAQAGVLKSIEAILQNKSAFGEIIKSIGDALNPIGKGWGSFINGVFSVLGGGFDLSGIKKAIQLFKNVFAR